ncbi:hypothetical protein BAW75_01520 [Micromonospora chalcea]|nr:hypothetical protein BAW75_01520 [Micromonospora chalcea]
MLQHALRHGTVDTNADLSAVAVWYGRGEVQPAVEPDHQDALKQATGKCAPVFNLLDAMPEADHPRIPHDCLAYLAVDILVMGERDAVDWRRPCSPRLPPENPRAWLTTSDD